MILESKELELAAVAASLAAGCVPCTKYHIAAAKKLGTQTSDINESLTTAARLVADSLVDLQLQFGMPPLAIPEVVPATGISRNAALTIVGAAISRNSVKRLKEAIEVARGAGIDDAELMEIIGLANRIKEKAASHLVVVTKRLDADPDIANSVAGLCT